MARNRTSDTQDPLPMGSRQSTRLMLVLVGTALILGALVTPWWTRGFNVQWDAEDNPRPAFLAGVDGVYHNYGPFQTPGASFEGVGGDSTDAARETATAVLGVAVVSCILFVAAGLAIRYLMATGRVEENLDTPVRLSIIAFVCGLFAVVWAAFFLPLAGHGGGWLYGDEPEQSNTIVVDGQEIDVDEDNAIEVARYANVGFFLGIVGTVGFPAYLWLDAARERAVHGAPTARRAATGSVTF